MTTSPRGHADVQTTMIHTHVMNNVDGRGVRSPLEFLWPVASGLPIRQPIPTVLR
jgi:hypothetical protein